MGIYNQILSVSDTGLDIKTLFTKIINHFDPNKSKNKKTHVLDCSNFINWNELDLRAFDVTQTRNLEGYVKENIYDIIIFDPPINRSFLTTSVESAKVFNKILSSSGIVIVKIKDFKDDDSQELKGSYDIKTIFKSCNFYLTDQIIHKNNRYNENKGKNVDIVHSYFLIFKKNK